MSTAITGVIIGLIIFFLAREVVCWYWKINEQTDLLKSINNRLGRLVGEAEKSPTYNEATGKVEMDDKK